MAVLKVEKVVSALPGTLAPDTIYLVRVGTGFDLYSTDSTGAIAYQNNMRGETFAGSRWLFSDFNNTAATGNPPFTVTALSTGTFTTAPAVADALAQGTLLLRGSNTANSGVRIATTQPWISASGLAFRAIAYLPTLATRTLRVGFHDATTSTDAVDGAYFEVTNLTVVAKTASNSTRTTSGTTFVLTAATFYVFDIEYVSATSVRFRVSQLSNGTLVYDQTISTNVPSAIARAFFPSLVVTKSSGPASDLMLIDYMGFGPAKPSYIKMPFVAGA
jgi:hypothetical protein